MSARVEEEARVRVVYEGRVYEGDGGRVCVALRICKALNYLRCHDESLPAYHRDVKASNVG